MLTRGLVRDNVLRKRVGTGPVALIGSSNQQEAVRANLEKRSPRFQD